MASSNSPNINYLDECITRFEIDERMLLDVEPAEQQQIYEALNKYRDLIPSNFQITETWQIKLILGQTPDDTNELLGWMDSDGSHVAHFATLFFNQPLLEAIKQAENDDEEPFSLLTTTNGNGISIAHYAALNGTEAFNWVKQLAAEEHRLDGGTDDSLPALIDHISNRDGDVTHFAALGGNTAVLQTLYEAYPALFGPGNDFAEISLEKGDLATLNWLYDTSELRPLIHDDSPDSKQPNPLMLLAKSGNLEAFEWGLERYPELIWLCDDNGHSIVHSAISSGNPVLIRKALEVYQRPEQRITLKTRYEVHTFTTALDTFTRYLGPVHVPKDTPRGNSQELRKILERNRQIHDNGHRFMTAFFPYSQSKKFPQDAIDSVGAFVSEESIDITTKQAKKAILNFQQVKQQLTTLILDTSKNVAPGASDSSQASLLSEMKTLIQVSISPYQLHQGLRELLAKYEDAIQAESGVVLRALIHQIDAQLPRVSIIDAHTWLNRLQEQIGGLKRYAATLRQAGAWEQTRAKTVDTFIRTLGGHFIALAACSDNPDTFNRKLSDMVRFWRDETFLGNITILMRPQERAQESTFFHHSDSKHPSRANLITDISQTIGQMVELYGLDDIDEAATMAYSV